MSHQYTKRVKRLREQKVEKKPEPEPVRVEKKIPFLNFGWLAALLN